MIDSTSFVRRKENLLAYDMDGETVMMSLEQGNYYALDGIGSRIWELIEKPASVVGILKTLEEEFEVEPAVCEQDTLAFLTELKECGIIEVTDEAPA